MLATTGRCLAIWLKITLALAILLAVAGIVWGFSTGQFTLAVFAAIVVELVAIRGLVREWMFDARGTWWWIG